MPNRFLTAQNSTVASAKAMCSEDFTILSGANGANGANGVAGTYAAVSIDDLSHTTRAVPGQVKSDNTVDLHVERSVAATAQLEKGTVLTIRGNAARKVRVNAVNDDGSAVLTFSCGPAGLGGG